MHYESTRLIGGREVDGNGHCKASALLDRMQTAAILAAEYGGFGQELTARYGAFWMLARAWYRLERPVQSGQTLAVRTWHRGGKGALMYRDYDLLADGVPVGEGVSGWVLARVADRKLLRLSDVAELAGTGGGPLCKDRTLSKLRMPQEMQPAGRRQMYYSDTDINGHVNNTRYADFVCDALQFDRLPPAQFLQEFQIGYTAECRAGESLGMETAAAGETSFVRGIDDGGKIRFEAAVKFGQGIA